MVVIVGNMRFATGCKHKATFTVQQTSHLLFTNISTPFPSMINIFMTCTGIGYTLEHIIHRSEWWCINQRFVPVLQDIN